jgi:hypothetical protein
MAEKLDNSEETPSFVCAQCGQSHEGLLTDQGWKLPDAVWAIPEPERATRAHYDTDLCQLDERFFIRCILRIPFSERERYFGWGVWVDVEREDFVRYVQLYNVDAHEELAKRGTLRIIFRAMKTPPTSASQFNSAVARNNLTFSSTRTRRRRLAETNPTESMTRATIRYWSPSAQFESNVTAGCGRASTRSARRQNFRESAQSGGEPTSFVPRQARHDSTITRPGARQHHHAARRATAPSRGQARDSTITRHGDGATACAVLCAPCSAVP